MTQQRVAIQGEKNYENQKLQIELRQPRNKHTFNSM